MEKNLMKITSVRFGHGGYQDCQLGLHLCFEGSGCGIHGSVVGGWSYASHPKPPEHARWDEARRSADMVKMLREISELLEKAKVDTIDRLVGTPVWVYIHNGRLDHWEPAKEIL